MPEEPLARAGEGEAVPSMLDLVRLSPRRIFPPGGVELYRHIALLADLSAGDEVLDVGCGTGVPLEYWVREHSVQGSGVDADPGSVERAEERAREADLSERLQFQEGRPDDLPYRDAIFDVVVGEMGITSGASPEAAIRELARVARPGAAVILIQLVWKAPVDPLRRQVLSSHLGARPLMLVELKRLLREAGVVDLHSEDWSDEETAFRRRVAKPFPDFAELFSLPEKVGILRRAWSRWGWRGVKAALVREREVHRLLTRERIIGLDLVLGTRAAAPGEEPAEPKGGRARRSGRERAPLPDSGPAPDRGKPVGDGTGQMDQVAPGAPEETASEEDERQHEETVGLPLFGDGEEGEE